jgi:type IV secretory pathway VirB2 component (pilin)
LLKSNWGGSKGSPLFGAKYRMNISNIITFMTGKKTYSASVISIATVVLAYLSGQASLIDALQIIVPAILAATMRSAIKSETATPS